MKIIELTQGYKTIVDDPDYEELNKYLWCVWIPSGKPYAASALGKGKKLFKMHRVILKLDDPKIKVDHRDGDGLNNRRSNLRLATSRQNNQNAVKSSMSPYRGIQQVPSGNWQASIRDNFGTSIYLGTFREDYEAAKAYDEAAKKFHKEFAVLNFP